MESIELTIGNFIKWRIRMLMGFIFTIIYTIIFINISNKFVTKNNDLMIGNGILLSSFLIIIFYGQNKKFRPSEKVSFEFYEKYFIIRYYNKENYIYYNNIIKIYHKEIAFGGKWIDEVIGFFIIIKTHNASSIRIDSVFLEENNIKFENTDLSILYKKINDYCKFSHQIGSII